MSTVTVEQARKIIASLYSSPVWKEKCKTMPDKQVLAIYFSSCERDAFSKQEKKRKEKRKRERNHTSDSEYETDCFYEEDHGEQLSFEL